ncbi:Stress response protein NST1 [Debaryomyces fabryi]|uniref:Stress response protein NST1 n=1 Tax=Debaryomyces fabryi TaxID=58627 RepID=A0A0V1Q587_9ASCO|nr:Stress response protein NST1 [Debaryomyces fabryi]KSA03634.1 Stress response protein NST1 [Debaryomyces fabryi]CUM52674.1 unnamed protein product [Debaryomyces fabryi]
MSGTQADPIDVSKFKNGDDVHFDYNSTSNNQTINSTNVQKKKKKKKSKNKHKGPSNVEVTLNDPDVDYPTSRVIKQAPNGDVIIESLDEPPTDVHEKSVTANIWDNATLEEQENLKEFWESLDEAQKIELVKIDKKSVMDLFKNESKTLNALTNHQSNSNIQGSVTGTSGGALNGSSTNANITGPSNSSNGACTCSYCGRKNNFIEDELENIYDNHFDDIIDFIHEIRDINDLNALPGLLFGGFHMLEEEHKLQKRQQKHKYKQERELSHDHHHHEPGHICNDSHLNGEFDEATKQDQDQQLEYEHEITEHEDEGEHENAHSHNHSHSHNHNGNHSHSHNHNTNHNHSHSHFHYNQIEELNNESELPQEAILQESLDYELNKELEDESENNQLSVSTREQRVFHKLLDPKLFEALENLDFEKMKDTPANNQLAHILEKAGSLRDIIRDLHKADKVELEKGMAFLQNMGKIFSSDMSNTMNHDTLNEQLSHGLSSFAEDLLKNDGNSFIDMMESLSESRTAREDLLKEKFEKEPNAAWVDEDDHTKSDTGISIPKPELHQVQELADELNDEYDEENEGDEEEEEEEEEEDEEDEEELEDEEFEEDEEEDASDTESEISEEEKMQEIRRLFLIQVIKLFQERLKNAYKEKLSQDRTRKLIEELEAEENAKKEREMKKLRQKEKAKEKKRLQQLAKEEERRKKEEEQKAKEEELRQKQEALKTEQKRKKEEAKQKREEEKRKRIEDLKRKELEQQKRLEAQRKKEEETKRLKDEKKKKAEEERKQREEEKKQKELQKKLAEEERLKSLKKQEHKEIESSDDMGLLSRNLENARLDKSLDTPSAVVPETLLAQTQEQRVKSPTKNHILDQLYLAKPRSLSNSTNSTPQINNATPGYNIPELSSNNILPSVLSPSGHKSLPINGNGNVNQAVPSPWSSQAFNANTQTPPVYQPQFSSNAFSPFNSSFNQSSLSTNSKENINTNPLNAAGFNEPFATAAQPSSVWNPGTTSRNNSIWSNSPNVSSNSTLWNNAIPPPPVGAAAVGAHPNNQDSDIIQAAAYQAFQFMQTSNQLEFGVAPSLKLFQTAKAILSNQGLTLNQFLTSCRNTDSLSGYRFDFIYDDFGTVTHIKASSTNLNQQAQHNNINNQPINNMGLGNAAVNGNESLLNTLSDINNNPNSFSNGVRGLWN